MQLPLISASQCSQVYKQAKVTLGPGQLCAGGETGKDSCRGDSGGSLMSTVAEQQGEINWFAVGIVSFGPSPCGTTGWPGVYTNVGHYIQWIVSKIKP